MTIRSALPSARPPRLPVWQDVRRDWRRWSRAERIAAPVILGCAIAATMPVLWLIAQ